MRTACCCLLLLMWGCSCAGVASRTAIPGLPEQRISVGGQALAVPPGADPVLLQRLAAELRRILAAQPRHPSARSTAYFAPSVAVDGADAVLSWSYFMPGDYNQDGLVSLPDLAQLGLHFGYSVADSGWVQHQVADGNGDGTTNLSDVAPIGINWQHKLARYIIESAPDAAGPWSAAGAAAASAGVMPVGGGLKVYTLRVTGGAALPFFRVHGDGEPPATGRVQQLRAAKHFMYQLQGLEEPGGYGPLISSHYDMLVVEPSKTVQGSEDFDMAGMVAALKASANSQGGRKLVLAYVDIGQAEDYRTYWQAGWVPPTATQRGVPDFLLTIDPDGWSGNYPVAYWDARWQALLVDDAGSVLHQLLDAGFDGIYMDWVGGYSEPAVVQAAAEAGKDPAAEMLALISHLREVARQTDPQFLLVQQNAPELIHAATGLADVIDGLGMEDIWFLGDSSAPWGDPLGGDIPQANSGDYSTPALIALAQEYQAAGLPVLTIDYCLIETNAAQVYADSQALGFIPLVSQISLSQLTGTPPPWY